MVAEAEVLVEVHRKPVLESRHRGHVAIWHHDHGLIAAWGNVEARYLPRSSAKMIQALPLVESGAADSFGLHTDHLALACASHNGAAIHTDRVTRWLADLDLTEADLRCGAQWPNDDAASAALICADAQSGQRHNNCSGKHSGFLTLNKHLGGGAEYIDPTHPVQRAVKQAWGEVTGEDQLDHAIDGCSAPNFVTRLTGLAKAMATFAAASETDGTRGAAMVRLRNAMMQHPDLVAGEGRACTRLMRAMGHRATIKTGAEGVFIAIVPEHRLGIALKIEDGATRAAEAVVATLLGNLGVLNPQHADALAFTHGPILNRCERETGHYRVAGTIQNWRL
ncbi:asparaginase [Gymnodinialimonas sp. 2305UL16-5]|uniref:asparaginase n=1 Tax=Gymnodinialimonas mytili TaxID=3126503 RepID=UPI00309C495C